MYLQLGKSVLVLCPKVTQDPTKMNRNDAPVSLELPPERCMVSSRQQKTPIERPTVADDIQTPLFHSGFKTDIDTMTQDAWDHSKASNEVLSTNVQKSPLKSPVSGENALRCNISLSILESQFNTTIKAVEGTEIQHDEKAELTKLLVESDAPNEKIVEMETETAAVNVTEQTKTEKSKDARNEDTGGIIVDAPCKQTGQKEHISKVVKKSSLDLKHLKEDINDTSPKIAENKTSVEHIKGFQEISKPETKIISIAELLRSQIKALESTSANPVSDIPSHSNLLHNQSITARPRQELVQDDRKLEVKKFMPERENKKGVDESPPTTIKATLMEVYHQLHKTDYEQSKTQSATSQPLQALLMPPISVIDSGTNKGMAGLDGSVEKYNGGAMDIGKEIQPSIVVQPENCSVVVSQQTTPKLNFPSLTSEVKLISTISSLSGTASQEPEPPLRETNKKQSIQEANIINSERTKDELVQGKDVQFIQKLTPEIKLSSTNERDLTAVSDQCKMEEQYTNTSSLQSIERLPPETGSNIQGNNLPLILKEVKEGLPSDSTANQTAEPSPSLKKRNCVSPIPSATPQELASGARRKILTPKAKPEETTEVTSPADNQTLKREASTQSSKLSTTAAALSVSPSLLRRSSVLQPTGEQTSLLERRSPTLSKKKMASETPSQLPAEEIQTERKPEEKDKRNPFKGKERPEGLMLYQKSLM